MSANSQVPSPTGDRFVIISDNDHRGIIWVISILCIIYSLMIMVLRVEAKRKNFGWDDWLATSATIFAFGQYIAIFVAISHGLGRSFSNISPLDAEVIGKSLLASEILLLLALGLAKCSVIHLCRRLFGPGVRSRLILCDITLAICATWSVGSALAVAIDCPSTALIGFRSSLCPNLVRRWEAVGALDCVTEIPIVLLATLVVWPLQMSRTRKAQALVSFFFRPVIIVLAILHITSLSNFTTSRNRGVAITNPSVYLQVELFYALLSSAIPALNRWLRNFDTSMGTTWASAYGSQQYGSNDNTGKSGSHSYRMESLNKSKSGPKAAQVLGSNAFTPGNNEYNASCERETAADRHSSASHEDHSNGSIHSEDMIIRKNVDWQVRYEDHNGRVGQAV